MSNRWFQQRSHVRVLFALTLALLTFGCSNFEEGFVETNRHLSIERVSGATKFEDIHVFTRHELDSLNVSYEELGVVEMRFLNQTYMLNRAKAIASDIGGNAIVILHRDYHYDLGRLTAAVLLAE